MNKFILFAPLLFFGICIAYAELIEDIQTQVLSHDEDFATVQINWSY
ncbi:MAG: hypothetical protein OEY10_04530 [Nitrosopumilus sp.]|nr:hypothetical protein [Nitrosopumilus sp.]